MEAYIQSLGEIGMCCRENERSTFTYGFICNVRCLFWPSPISITSSFFVRRWDPCLKAYIPNLGEIGMCCRKNERSTFTYGFICNVRCLFWPSPISITSSFFSPSMRSIFKSLYSKFGRNWHVLSRKRAQFFFN